MHGAEATLSVLTLEPGIEVPEHSHIRDEQMGVLVHGSVTFHIGDEDKALRPGATWVIPAHVPHSVEVGPDSAPRSSSSSRPLAQTGAVSRNLHPGAPSGFGLDHTRDLV